MLTVSEVQGRCTKHKILSFGRGPTTVSATRAKVTKRKQERVTDGRLAVDTRHTTTTSDQEPQHDERCLATVECHDDVRLRLCPKDDDDAPKREGRWRRQRPRGSEVRRRPRTVKRRTTAHVDPTGTQTTTTQAISAQRQGGPEKAQDTVEHGRRHPLTTPKAHSLTMVELATTFSHVSTSACHPPSATFFLPTATRSMCHSLLATHGPLPALTHRSIHTGVLTFKIKRKSLLFCM